MTQKAQTPLKTKKSEVTVELWVKKYKLRKPNFIVRASDLTSLRDEEFPAFKAQLLEGAVNKEDVFSLPEEVTEVLETPELERDKDGKIKRNQQEQAQAKPFSVKTQRIINRVLGKIEPVVDKQTTSKGFKIKLKPSDAIYLAERMMTHFDEYPRVRKGVTDAYDHFVRVKADAEVADKTED